MEYKIQSLENALAFLQEQHAATISGLQEEINKLQKKCSSLIHQVAASGLQDNFKDSKESSKQTELEEMLNDTQIQYTKLKDALENKEGRIFMLEAQSKSKEQKYLNDLKHYQRKAAELQNELEHKSASIAYLTTKLHQSKMKDTVLTNDIVLTAGKGNDNLSPSPPRGQPPSHHQERKNIRCFVNAPAANVAGIVVESNTHDIPVDIDRINSPSKISSVTGRHRVKTKHSIFDPARPALGLSQSKRDRDLILVNRPKPTDYEDFIKMNESDNTVTKPIVEPLPPITPRSGKTTQPHGKTYANKNVKTRTNSTGEVETVIVETSLPSPDRPYGKIQDLS